MDLRLLASGLLVAILASGCTHRTSVSVDPTSKTEISPARQNFEEKVAANDIVLTKDTLEGWKYSSLGSIFVSISKATAFNQMPNQAMIDARLRQEAFKLGADAVILVRYGQPGMSLFSWGKLEGRGRAIKFVK